MTAEEHLQEALCRLQSLNDELHTSETAVCELTLLINAANIARVELAGGHVFYQVGTLGKLQRARMRRDILHSAIELQEQCVHALHNQAAAEARSQFTQKYDDIVDSISHTTVQLAELITALDNLRSSEHFPLLTAARQASDERSADEWPSEVESILQQLLQTTAQASSRRAA